MKKMRDLRGMSIVTLEEGEQLGRIRELILDPTAIHVAALLLDRRTPGGEPQVVATANIHKVGQEAVTVPDRSSLVPLSRIPRFQKLVQTRTPIRGKLVITEGGSRLGLVADLLVNTETFAIEALLLKGSLFKAGPRIGAEQIRTIGPDAVVVKERPTEPKPSKPSRRPAVPPPVEAAEVELPEEVPTPIPPPIGEPSPLPGEVSGEEAEPAVPPISTLDEAPPPAETFPPAEEPAPFEETTPPPAPAEPPSEEEPGEQGGENPWQRWVRRLRRREEAGPEAS